MTTPLERAVAKRGRRWLDTPDALPPGMVRMDGDAVDGQTPADVRDATIAALRAHRADHYTRRPGIAPLCRSVAEELHGAGVAVDPDSGVVITGGAQEARFVALRALVNGRTVLLPRPSPLPLYETAILFAGGTIELFDPDGELPAHHGALLVWPSPNPASGQLATAERAGRIASWAAAHELTVIADETASALLRPEQPFVPFAALPGMGERTLTLGSFAAVPGLVAWQVGWFAGPKTLATPVRDLKQAITICSPAPSQYAALAGLDGRWDAGAQRMERVEAVCALLDDAGIAYLEPHTTVWVVANMSGVGGGDTATATLARHGVVVAAGSRFGAPDTIRITAAATDFAEGLERLAAGLIELTGREVRA